MSPTLIWILVAIVLIIIEINIFTFYLLSIAVGCVIGAVLSYFDMSLTVQCTGAGIITILCAIYSLFLRKKLKHEKDHLNNNLDLGQYVEVKSSDLQDNGMARVMYRGTQWSALSVSQALQPGIYQIEKIDGTRLILSPKIADLNQPQKEESSQVQIQTEPTPTESDSIKLKDYTLK